MGYENQPYLGKESAPVKIVEFGDYKCPICKNFNETFFPQIQNDLIETGTVQFYFMNYAFINIDSTRTAQFAEAVYDVLGKDDFWRFHEVIYQKQPYNPSFEKMDIFTDTFLLQTLTEVVGTQKTEKVKKVYKDRKYKKALDKDMFYVNKLSVSGTPTLFINDKKFEGNTFEQLKQAVEEAKRDKSNDE
ncbi:DsbA family protein [Bacillus canaveralius]|uniref:DsbA family protein n=1 Tax=Bacillus canaveralius TaxID=1403243 RepID=UPI00289CC2E2|nr:DsbA family protein [Bacillus canaveralius]